MGAEVPDEERQTLLSELAAREVKHSPENVVAIGRDDSGRVVFLELGNGRAGLKHILERHGEDFTRAGIEADEIPQLVILAATRGVEVGWQRTRPVFRVEFGGMARYVGVTVGDNGFVVGANPVSASQYESQRGEAYDAENQIDA